MIYFDNSATTYPKPVGVRDAVIKAIERYGGNPGRGGHTYAMQAAQKVFDVRVKLAEMFHVSPEQVIFTKNCTEAINLAIAAIPDHTKVLTSDLEHNAVVRPLEAANRCGRLFYRVVPTGNCPDDFVKHLAVMLTPDVSAVVMTAASNVTGQILPIAEVGAFCRKHGLIFILDAAQAVGVIPIDCQSCGIDFLCASGHKGLYGITGTGMLLSLGSRDIPPLLYGGTGTDSLSLTQNHLLPEDLEAGTLPTVGICALEAGIDYLHQQGMEGQTKYNLHLCGMFYDACKQFPQIRVYSPNPKWENCVPIVSFAVDGISSERVAQMLSTSGFALRGGYQCAAVTHQKLGTTATGVVRFSPGCFNTESQVKQLIKAISGILSENLRFSEKRS